jgi:hypothetical protein
MRTVNIAELEAHLSAHIQLVRDGEEVLVCDRTSPWRGLFLAVWKATPSRSSD